LPTPEKKTSREEGGKLGLVSVEGAGPDSKKEKSIFLGTLGGDMRPTRSN